MMEPGKQIGDYVIGEYLAEGGMSVVYLAEDQRDGKRVVVKRLREELRLNMQLVERFTRGARIMQELRHPHLARVLDYLEFEGEYFMVEEHLDGGTLADVLDSGPASEADAMRWCRDALRAVDYANQHGIVHRDLKPGNLMLDDNGEVKVTDFGIAKVIGGPRLTRAGAEMGTPAYMSPEQIRATDQVDHLTDVYSMGVVLYELLTGRLPFNADTDFLIKEKVVREVPERPRRIRPEVSARTERIVMKAMKKRPNARFGGCAEFALAIDKSLESTPPLHPNLRWIAGAACFALALVLIPSAWNLILFSGAPLPSQPVLFGGPPRPPADQPPDTSEMIAAWASGLAAGEREAPQTAGTGATGSADPPRSVGGSPARTVEASVPPRPPDLPLEGAIESRISGVLEQLDEAFSERRYALPLESSCIGLASQLLNLAANLPQTARSQRDARARGEDLLGECARLVVEDERRMVASPPLARAVANRDNAFEVRNELTRSVERLRIVSEARGTSSELSGLIGTIGAWTSALGVLLEERSVGNVEHDHGFFGGSCKGELSFDGFAIDYRPVPYESDHHMLGAVDKLDANLAVQDDGHFEFNFDRRWSFRTVDRESAGSSAEEFRRSLVDIRAAREQLAAGVAP